MKKTLRGVLYLSVIFLLLVSLATAECVPSKREMYVPAVVNENSSVMALISVETRPGDGKAFVSVYPTIGPNTQLSEKTAAAVAFSITKQRDCDVFLEIDVGDNMNQVDGPSAGAAITLLTLSALRHEPLHSDFSITGTIEESGRIGEVGGIPLKAESVAKAGGRFFLVPKLSEGEKIYLIILDRFYDIDIVEVSDVTEAYSLAVQGNFPKQNLSLSADEARTFPSALFNSSAAFYFQSIASSMISEANKNLVDAGDSVKENFFSRLRTAQNALDTNNLYTAANVAFLLNIDEDLLEFSDKNMIDTEYAVDKCLSDFSVSTKSLENYEMLAAAELRYLWAISRKPKDIAIQSTDFIAPKVDTYYDLIFAKYWCKAATDFAGYLPAGNQTYFDEEIAKDIAQKLLIDASVVYGAKKDDADIALHFETAGKAFNESRYIATIIDASYVVSSAEAEQKANDTANVINELSNASMTHFLPQMYVAHAKTFEDTNNMTALRLYLFADYIEKSFDELDAMIAKTPSAIITLTPPKKNATVETGIDKTVNYIQMWFGRISEKDVGMIFLVGFVIIIFATYILHIRQLKRRRVKR